MLLKKKEAKYLPPEEDWWGYLHVNGTIQIKSYHSAAQLQDAKESTFVELIVYPFKTSSREEAEIIITKKIEDAKSRNRQQQSVRSFKTINLNGSGGQRVTSKGLKCF